MDPLGRYVYVARRNAGTLAAYRIDPQTGHLTEIGGSPYAVAGTLDSVAIAPDGQSLFVSAWGNPGKAYDFAVNPDSGALTPAGNVTVQNAPDALVVHPNGRLLFVGDEVAYDFLAFHIDPA